MNKLIFLCIGNSLTAGYPGYNPAPDGISKGYGNQKSQYEYWLKMFCIEYLEKNLGSIEDEILKELVFVNKGVPGELTRNLLSRVNMDLVRYKPKPHYSIIIGGTNDLGWRVENRTILKNIQELHSISRTFGIISIGGIIPPIRMELSNSRYHEKKVEINNLLIDYFNSENILYADLYEGMQDENGNLKGEYAYSDGLHFSVEGYRQMGSVIFQDVIKNILLDTIIH
ncbi:MAG: hypothetical protein GF383_06280 [Candidatus Lokiarchaeota archaeon]|nr:hypothetical protein [Candidatus Lokiarchaeota archaeon]MBD3339611.1 hypothetical protein [Candidatus Lokiarchaeota archaeon]